MGAGADMGAGASDAASGTGIAGTASLRRSAPSVDTILDYQMTLVL